MKNPVLTETITLKGIIDEDFVNYKVPSMTLMFPYCDFKCETNGEHFCQNSSLIKEKDIIIPIKNIYKRYINNPITSAIVMQGMEPFKSWDELYSLLVHFRIHECCTDDIVIYTGYNKDEILNEVNELEIMFSNVIIKYGRYIPNRESRYDDILGVTLASDNQYAERI